MALRVIEEDGESNNIYGQQPAQQHQQDERNHNNPLHDSASTMTEWECGDVYEDLRKLEMAIQLYKAEDDLVRSDRLELLNAMGRQKYPVEDVIRIHVLPPVLFSWWIVISTKRILSARPSWPITWKLLFWGQRLSACHFWSMVVGFPVVLMGVAAIRSHHRRSARIKAPEIPRELQRAGPEYYRFITGSGFGEEVDILSVSSCNDYARCLTEQWISAVLGVALSGPFLPAALWPWTRCLVRFAAHASLHQFPKLWFLQTRDTRTRPLRQYDHVLSVCTRCLATPWFLAWDVATQLVASGQSWTILTSGYASLVSGLLLLARKSRKHPKNSPSSSSLETRERQKPSTKRLRAIGWLGLMFFCLLSKNAVPLNNLVDYLGQTRSSSFRSLGNNFDYCSLKTSWRTMILSPVAVVIALLGPVCHLIAFQRLIRVAYTHNLSLALDRKEFVQKMDDPARNQWRVWLKWREPERIRTVIRKLRERMGFWLFVSGTPGELLEKQRNAILDQEMRQSGDTILRRLQTESTTASGDTFPYGTLERRDRTKWKQIAMERQAKIHQDNYQTGNFGADPLGIALHQHFGIGLGFNYDHTSDLKPGEVPTLRRLQARAAKSAIKRARELHDPKVAVARGILQKYHSYTNPYERDRKAVEMRQKAEAEMQFLAKKITDLLPTNKELGEEQVDMYQTKPTVSNLVWDDNSKSYVILARPGWSSSVEKLYRDGKESLFDIDYLNPGAGEGPMSDPGPGGRNAATTNGQWDNEDEPKERRECEDEENYRELYT